MINRSNSWVNRYWKTQVNLNPNKQNTSKRSKQKSTTANQAKWKSKTTTSRSSVPKSDTRIVNAQVNYNHNSRCESDTIATNNKHIMRHDQQQSDIHESKNETKSNVNVNVNVNVNPHELENKPKMIDICKLNVNSYQIVREYMKNDTLFSDIAKQIDWYPWQGKTNTRLVWHYEPNKCDILDNIIGQIMFDFKLDVNYNSNCRLNGIFLNYYPSLNDYTPMHRHLNESTLLLSLGESRILTIEKDNILLNNGDIAIFHGQRHGVPQQNNYQQLKTTSESKFQGKGRISIVFFYKTRYDLSDMERFLIEKQTKITK